MSVRHVLRRARSSAGLSLRQVADASGVARSNLSAIEQGRRAPTTTTADRIADAIGVKLVPVVARGRVSVAEAVEAIRESEATGDVTTPYRAFLQLANDLGAVGPVERVLLSAEEPACTGGRWDDAVAGLAEWRLQQAGAPVPAWISARRGDELDVWEPRRSRSSLPSNTVAERVPIPLRRRGILIEEGELTSA